MGTWVVSRGLKAPLVSSSPSLLLSLSPQRNISYLVSYRILPPEKHRSMVDSSVKTAAPTSIIKFLCSYGGKILPRYPDGKLRYIGGETRVLAADRSVPFSGLFSISVSSAIRFYSVSIPIPIPRILSCWTLRFGFLCAELLLKLGELYGSAVSLRCQLPTEDLDALVSITCDEDLSNLIEEYDRANRKRSDPLKIRAFLAPPKSKPSPPSTATGRKKPYPAVGFPPRSIPTADRCASPHQISAPVRFPVGFAKSAGNRSWLGKNNENSVFLVHNGNHWQ